jgi:Protein of unknown function (DUF2971)
MAQEQEEETAETAMTPSQEMARATSKSAMQSFTPPERLYHFTTARYALDDLRNRRLKIAQFNDLNDPFELKSVDLSGPGDEFAFDRWIEEMAPRFGLLCFTDNWKDVLQWSHYADRHKGICLGFDVSGAADRFGNVRYEPRKGPLPEKRDELFMWDLLRTKFTAWHQEREWRVFMELTDPTSIDGRDLYFKEFDDNLVLRDVLLGAANRNEVSEVRAAIGGSIDAEAVRIARVRLSPSQFTLEL